MPEVGGITRAMVVVAHPDDCDFGCAGTTALMTGAGVEVTYCIVTDGDAGGADRSASRSDVARLRRKEQTAAAAEVGVSDLVFLGYPDGRLTATLELRRDITRVIRQRRPERLLCQAPNRNFARIFTSHPDHLAVGEAALCAVYPDSRNPFAHAELLEQEGLEPHTVRETWLMATLGSQPPADTVIDVTETLDRKLEALRCHASQYQDWEALAERVRGWLAANAAASGLSDGRFAECFTSMSTG